jgi:radical SAM protein with 4Fe4S-binding SPASM domain
MTDRPRPSDRAVFDGRVPAPDFVNIETTRFCNLQCRMCIQFNEGLTVAGPHMELEVFEKVAREVFPFVRRWQPTVSGEPTMTKDFREMLAIAESFGVKAEMVTNATLLDDDMIVSLASNLGALMISFDGAERDTFEFIRSGARYDEVKDRIRKLVAHCREELPPDLQPQLGINCTLMERNVRELPALVRLAAEELDLDFVSVYHVFPITEEMKAQSLVHHRELARRCIDEAFEVAAELGIALTVEALDQLTAATASTAESDRQWATVDGVVEGLERREINQGTRRPLPLFDERHPRYAEISARRAAVGAESEFPPRRSGDPAAAPGDSIWWCDFLWNKTYVYVGGNVRPCCVHQVPTLGNVEEQPFDELWNNENYRVMRQRLVAKLPAPSCKGCMHIREIEDPVEIDRLLQGKAIPRADELLELTAALDPACQRRRRAGDPPVLVWDAVTGARSYVVEFSLDRFTSVLFSTDAADGGPAIRESRYRVPLWAWWEAPADREIFYRVLAKLPDGTVEVSQGSIP